MRARPHILSTRLADSELAQYVQALAAPGGGWYCPAHYARWALLSAPSPAPAAISIDLPAIRAARPRFAAIGRQLNQVAFTLNSGVSAPPSMGRLAGTWPKVAADVLAAVQPTGAVVSVPVPVQFVAPAVARTRQPAFNQHPHGARVRQTVVATRLSEEEYRQVMAAAERAGTDPADYFRSRLLGCNPLRQRRLPKVVALPLAAVLGECGRQASNWRQISRAFGRRGWPVPDVAEIALSALWEIRATITPTLARWRL
ncbi:MAG: hypothetical protein WCJ64_05670 [Rhodospirillaceae bacterium]